MYSGQFTKHNKKMSDSSFAYIFVFYNALCIWNYENTLWDKRNKYTSAVSKQISFSHCVTQIHLAKYIASLDCNFPQYCRSTNYVSYIICYLSFDIVCVSSCVTVCYNCEQ